MNGIPSLQHLRIQRYHEQEGRCYYCRNLMWERSIEPKRQAQFRVWPWRPGETIDVGRFLVEQICTAEHLQRVTEGGSDEPSNIVAACRRCNSSRHDKRTDLLASVSRDISALDERFAYRLRVRENWHVMREWCGSNLDHPYFVRPETALYAASGGAAVLEDQCMVLLKAITSDIDRLEQHWHPLIFD